MNLLISNRMGYVMKKLRLPLTFIAVMLLVSALFAATNGLAMAYVWLERVLPNEMSCNGLKSQKSVRWAPAKLMLRGLVDWFGVGPL